MIRSEDILRLYAKAERQNRARRLEVNIAPQVMDLIKAGQIELGSRRWFMLRRIAKIGGFFVFTSAAIGSLNVFVYLMERSGALEFLNIGAMAAPLVGPMIPLDMALFFGVAVVGGYALLRRFSIVLHHSHFRLASLYGLLVFGLSLSFSSAQLYDTVLAINPLGRGFAETLSKYYLTRAQYHMNEDYALIGRIINTQDGRLLVKTPNDNLVQLELTEAQEPFFTEGQIIKAAGHREGEKFYVSYADSVGRRGLEFFAAPITNF